MAVLFSPLMIPHLRLLVLAALLASNVARAQAPYTTATSIAGLFFELDGPYALQKGDIVIGANTSIRFFHKDEDRPMKLVYTINGSEPLEYTSAFRIQETGAHTIGYKLQDGDEKSVEFSLPLVVDNDSPVITASIVYKSITLKQFTFRNGENQNGIKIIECPVGSQLRVVAKDNIFSVEKVFLKEGKASLKIVEGAIELRSKGRHEYVIMAQDFIGNTTETAPIQVKIIEP